MDIPIFINKSLYMQKYIPIFVNKSLYEQMDINIFVHKCPYTYNCGIIL